MVRRKTTGIWQARKQASLAGEKWYLTGRPCASGHTSKRVTKTGTCVACHAARAARSRAANPEKTKTEAREWYRAHPERFSAWAKEYRQKNPERIRALNEGRRAREKGAKVGKVSAKCFAQILKTQKFKCSWCGISIRDNAQMDHITPLSKGGEHSTRNIVGSCPTCNRRKKDKDPVTWARELGLLL